MTNTYDAIPADRIASSKQIWAIVNKFTGMYIDSNGVERSKWKVFSKRIYAVLMSTNPKGISHGQIQSMFKLTALPKAITTNVKTDAKPQPKAKAVKAAPKPKAAKAAPKPKAAKSAPKPKATDDGFDARLKFLEETSVVQMQKIESIEDGLAQILLAVKG